MAKSLKDIIIPRAGRNVPKGEADFLDVHKVSEKDYPVKQKPARVPHQTTLKHDDHPTAPQTEDFDLDEKQASCNKTGIDISCPVHGPKDCSSYKMEHTLRQRVRRIPSMRVPHPKNVDDPRRHKVECAEGDEVDHEGEMAKAQLKALANKSAHLSMMMHDDQQLEAWVQSKISNAKQLVDGVYDYLMYRDKPEPQGRENETTGPDSAMQFPNMNTDNNYGAV